MRLIIITLSLFLWTCGGSTGPEEPKLPIVQNINLDVIEDTPKTFVFERLEQKIQQNDQK